MVTLQRLIHESFDFLFDAQFERVLSCDMERRCGTCEPLCRDGLIRDEGDVCIRRAADSTTSLTAAAAAPGLSEMSMAGKD